jgi:hypothetical protein
MSRLSVIVPLALLVLEASAASAQTPLGSADTFVALGGTAVTCTNSTGTGDLGVLAGVVTQTTCTVVGAVHQADSAARRAFMDFMSAYTSLEENPPACDRTLTGTLAGQVLEPGVYCLDATAKTGTLTLDAENDPDATWTFLVKAGALTGTSFNVVMINGGQPCNVDWWVQAAATMTDSNFLGTILAGAGITVTRGTLIGHALATAAVTLTDTRVTVCSSGSVPPDEDPCKKHRKCKCRCKCHGDHHGDGHHDGHGHEDGNHDKDHGKDCDRDHHDGDDDGRHGDKKERDTDRRDGDRGRDNDNGRNDRDNKDNNRKDQGGRNKK